LSKEVKNTESLWSWAPDRRCTYMASRVFMATLPV